MAIGLQDAGKFIDVDVVGRVVGKLPPRKTTLFLEKSPNGKFLPTENVYHGKISLKENSFSRKIPSTEKFPLTENFFVDILSNYFFF